MEFDPIEDVVASFRSGQAVLVVDDDGAGDLIVSADNVSAEAINFMLQEGRGLVCLCLPPEKFKSLEIVKHPQHFASKLMTAFGVSFDHRSVNKTGVSAESRAETIRAAVRSEARAEDFTRPGYVFPLCAEPGGVLQRKGHTEAAIDLCRLAGLTLAGVKCEVLTDDGELLGPAALADYCKKWNLKVTNLEAIEQHLLVLGGSIRRVAEFHLAEEIPLTRNKQLKKLFETSKDKDLRVIVYVDDVDGKEHFAILKGAPSENVLARVHSECLTGDVFDSLRCDCGEQLDQALTAMLSSDEGALIYLQQEGRGIGLGNKLRAYALQDEGKDTVDANLELGFQADERDYRVAAQMFKDLGILSVRLMTNNPEKVDALNALGLPVVERIAITCDIDSHNSSYLATKKKRMGHLIP